MKNPFMFIFLADIALCFILGLTGSFTDCLTMLYTCATTFIIFFVIACILFFVKAKRKITLSLVLNSVLMPFVIFIIYEFSGSVRAHNLYILYQFNTVNGDYNVYIQKKSNEFSIDSIFDGGSVGVVHGTYVCGNDGEYKLKVEHTNSEINISNELYIKNDTLKGFNDVSYPLNRKWIIYKCQYEGVSK